MAMQSETGSLLIVGGAEDRTGAKEVLQRFIELAGGKDKPMVVLTAASEVPDDVWALYRTAFADLGADHVQHIRTTSHEQADDEATAAKVRRARGIFMSGGAQKRLMVILGQSATAAAMHDAFASGACIAGTSAGASALCTDMLITGSARLEPQTGAIELGRGLGFVGGVIVDQHFSQRHRINRLLTIIGENPSKFGLGIDEDTGLVVQPGVGIEVVGADGINIIDCRAAFSDIKELPDGERPVMLGVALSLVPAGTAYVVPGARGSVLSDAATIAPPEITDFVTALVTAVVMS